VAEAWLAFPADSELPSQLAVADAELPLVVHGPPVARAEAEVSALPDPLEAQRAQEEVAGWDAPAELAQTVVQEHLEWDAAQAAPVQAFAEPKAAQSAV
jgi:hypothetical protein